MAELLDSQPSSGSCSRLRFSLAESAELYRRLLEAKAYEKAGASLNTTCEQLVDEIKSMAANDPLNRFRPVTITELTSAHVRKLMKGLMKVKIPPHTWKYQTTTGNGGTQVPAHDADGNLIYETDAEGHPIINPNLSNLRQVYFTSLLALQEKFKQQQSSTEQTAGQARERARQARITRTNAVQKRRQTFAKQKRRIKKRLKHDCKREKNALIQDHQFKKMAASAAIASSKASIAMKALMNSYVQHVTGNVQDVPPIDPPIQLPSLPTPTFSDTSSDSDSQGEEQHSNENTPNGNHENAVEDSNEDGTSDDNDAED